MADAEIQTQNVIKDFKALLTTCFLLLWASPIGIPSVQECIETTTAPAGTWPLRGIAQKATLLNVDVLRAVINGNLTRVWRLSCVRGRAALHLDLAEVLDAFEAPPLIGLTWKDLRKQLHVNGSTVSLLLKSGMIASKEAADPRTRQPLSLVAAEELDRFLDRHLPLGLMAHQLGTQARHVAARLDRAEVWPVPLPARCSKIYLREQAAPIIAI